MNFCNLCNYRTSRICNFTRHYNSNQHKDNLLLIDKMKNDVNIMIDELICYKCNKQLSETNEFYLHISKCGKMDNYINQDIKNTMKDTMKDTMKNSIIDNNNNNNNNLMILLNRLSNNLIKVLNNTEKNTLAAINNVYNKSNETSINVKKAIHSSHTMIKYLMINHKDTPPLEELSFDSCKKMLKSNYNIYDDEDKNDTVYKLHISILEDYKNNKFIDTNKQIILKTIKKEKNQSIYNTDSNRLNYVIKTSIYNWIEDKSGINFINLVIKPILTTIITLIKEYHEYIEEKNMDYNNKIDIIKDKLYELEKSVINFDDDYEQNYNNKYKLQNEYNDMILLLKKSSNILFDQVYYIKNFLYDLETNKYEKILIKELAPHLRILTNTDLSDYVKMIDNNKYDEYFGNNLIDDITKYDIIINNYKYMIKQLENNKLDILTKIMKNKKK